MGKIIYVLTFLLVCAQLTAQNVGWRNLYIPNIPINASLSDISIDKDTNFYVITDTSLFRYNGGIWSKLPPPLSTNEQLHHLAVDNQGGVWVSVFDKGVFRFSNNVWRKYDMSNSILPQNLISFIQYDSISKLMIIGTSHGVVTYNSITNTWSDIGVPINHSVSFFDPEGLVISQTGEWNFSTFFFPVYRYKPQTGVWETLSEFTSDFLFYKLGLDLSNNLYASNSLPQIIRYDTVTRTWRNLPFINGNSIAGFTVDKRNKMWSFSHANGITRFDTLNLTKFMAQNSPLYSDSIAKMVVAPNNLKYIVGKGGGIQILDDSALPLSTKEESFQMSKIISSYNNPIQQRLFLNIERTITTPQLTIQIHDLSGRMISEKVYTVNQYQIELNTDSLRAGMYFVTCVDVPKKIKETIKVLLL